MDDLKLLNALPGRVDPPDQAAKDRMRAMMEARTAPIRVRRRRRAKTVSLLGIAAVVTVATLAATIAARPWTAGEPVGLPSGSPDDNINDPTGRISTPGELASAVAEFAPAIRLPDGGSFDPWRLHLAAHPEWGTRVTLQRADLAESMVIVAECQWGQRWLDSSERGDHEVADQAMGIFATEGDWLLSAGAGDAWTGLVRDMRNGERLNIELFESGNCAYSGAWGSTPAERDAKAKERLTPAITTVPAYLRDGGDPQAFRPSTATDLTPGNLVDGVEHAARAGEPGLGLHRLIVGGPGGDARIRERGRCAILRRRHYQRRGPRHDDARPVHRARRRWCEGSRPRTGPL